MKHRHREKCGHFGRNIHGTENDERKDAGARDDLMALLKVVRGNDCDDYDVIRRSDLTGRRTKAWR